MTTRPVALDADDARQLAMAASLRGAPHLDSASVLRQLGLLQLDPLMRIEKAHRLTCLARMAPDAVAADLDQPLWSLGPAAAFETWVHAACLVPVEDWPLLRLTRERVLASPKRPPGRLLDQVRALVAENPAGATISEIEQPGMATKGWDWSERKRATEYMVRSGELICSARRDTKRVFDLPERRLPSHLLDARLTREEILGGLATRALAAMGVATVGDVAVYYNLTIADARTGLEIAGARSAVVQSWDIQAWILPTAGTDSSPAIHDPILIGPFDNLIWDRARTRRFFDFDYVFEAYKPQPARKYGYYVLALATSDGCFLGRADIRRDRNALTVLAAFPEPAVSAQQFTDSLNAAVGRLWRQLRPDC